MSGLSLLPLSTHSAVFSVSLRPSLPSVSLVAGPRGMARLHPLFYNLAPVTSWPTHATDAVQPHVSETNKARPIRRFTLNRPADLWMRKNTDGKLFHRDRFPLVHSIPESENVPAFPIASVVFRGFRVRGNMLERRSEIIRVNASTVVRIY